MNPLLVSVWLAGLIAVGGLIWINRHCLARTWAQRLGVGIVSGASVMICASQFARVSTALDSLPGNARAWLWVTLLLGVCVMVWAMALERKR